MLGRRDDSDATEVTARAQAKMESTIRKFNWRFLAGVGFMALTMIPAFAIGIVSVAKANEFQGAPCRGVNGNDPEYGTGAITASLQFIGVCCLIAIMACSCCVFAMVVEWEKMVRAASQTRLKSRVIALFREFGNPCVFCMCSLVLTGVTFWVIFVFGLLGLGASLGAADSACTDDPEEGGELYDLASATLGMGWLFLVVLGGQAVLVVLLHKRTKSRVVAMESHLDNIDAMAVVSA